MIIGVPKEIKKEEYRVALVPSGVYELVKSSHIVLIESDAGLESGFENQAYIESGAKIVNKKALFENAELIVKVKEPLEEEFGLFSENQAIFAYLHLAANQKLTKFLLERKITAFAYETLEKDSELPLLQPMSEIAGKMAPLVGAFYLQRQYGGLGQLASGMLGVRPCKALILGAGNVGSNAAKIAFSLGMDTYVLNRSLDKLKRIDELFNGRVKTLPLKIATIMEEIRDTDIVIGAVYTVGGRTPILIKRDMLKIMKKGSIIVDVCIDQGGCAETSRPTTHKDPIYVIDNIVHYCVSNMPGAYPKTSTVALTNATSPYVNMLAKIGVENAVNDPIFKSALNTHAGKIIHPSLL